jgi:hypothetical protein
MISINLPPERVEGLHDLRRAERAEEVSRALHDLDHLVVSSLQRSVLRRSRGHLRPDCVEVRPDLGSGGFIQVVDPLEESVAPMSATSASSELYFSAAKFLLAILLRSKRLFFSTPMCTRLALS